MAALRDGRITLYQAGSTQPLAQWSFTRGWPAALVFNGTEEELVIVHEGLTLGGTTGGGGQQQRGDEPVGKCQVSSVMSEVQKFEV